MKNLTTLCFLLGLVLIAASCAAPGRTASRQTDSNEVNPTKENISYLNLGEYLKRVPGVNVRNVGNTYSINIRSSFRLSGSTEPLFVVNSIPLASYDQAAALVNPMEIERVQVLKDVASSNVYGLRGGNGVIVIHLKQ